MEIGICVFLALVAFRFWCGWYNWRAVRRAVREAHGLEWRGGMWQEVRPPAPIGERLFLVAWWAFIIAALPVGFLLSR